MSGSTPERRILPRRSFGVQESSVQETSEGESNVIRRVSSRISLWSNRHRPTFVPWWTKGVNEHGEPESQTPTSGRAPIPTMMQSSGEAYTTPLPILSMIVLSIVRSTVFNIQSGMMDLWFCRQCSENSYLQMSQRHSYYSWSKVRIILSFH
jgi:hypothetical protein